MFIFIMDPATTTLSTLPYTTLFRSERIEDLPQAAARPNLKAFPVEVSRETGQVAPSVLERKDRKSTRLNSSHITISYAVFRLKKKKNNEDSDQLHRKFQDKPNICDE